MLRFEIETVDRTSGVRFGVAECPHGRFETPAFMPVGTQATVKSQTPTDLERAGVSILLVNAYHMAARPGEDLVASLGGLHRFMGWSGPILTDSGGYQIFSLAHRVRLTDDEVIFRSHVDGREMRIGPERAMEIQRRLGTDIAMALDECPAYPAPPDELRRAVDRTVRWAERCRRHLPEGPPALFGIVQGGIDAELRRECAAALAGIGFDGYAIGGLCVGEPIPRMRETVVVTAEALPADRIRYLMGVGTPEDILAAVEAGVDLFDCVIPTRNGRNAVAYTSTGIKRLRNARYASDPSPLDAECGCIACTRFPVAYLRHLFQSREMLGGMLLTHHNIAFYQRLVAGVRDAARRHRFAEYRDRFLARFRSDEPDREGEGDREGHIAS
jgi:queuine tRNA-ribosyltransferase